MKQTAPVSTAIVFLLALNLRPAVTSLGAALEDVSLAPGMTASVGAVLVALPLWASGIGGWITPWLKARIGIHRAVTWALIILGIALVIRVQSGAEVLIAGTALACLAIAIVGTVLPVLVQPAASRTKASFTLALGAGSTIGALVTPTLVAMFSWQFALAAWALLALVTVQAWQRAPRSSMVFMARALNPRQLFHSRVAWHLTIYFGLVSTLTFLIMGWLPAILRDAGVSASYAGFCLALSMAMGLPMMWLVPFGVNRMRRPGILVVLLAVLNGVGVVGLLVMPAVMPWLWSAGLGLGMGGLAMALTLISVRAAGNPDITTALSGMVQGLGYFIAGVGALACGLVHSATGSWELPLIIALIVLCGQVWSGVRATRPIVVAPRPIAELESARVKPDLTRPVNNGTRTKTLPEPWTNGVPVTAKAGPVTNGFRLPAAEPALDPDVTQPVKGVWITAVTELATAGPKLESTHLSNGVRVTGVSEPESGSAEGVRVTAESGQAAESAQPVNGARAAVSDPESDLVKPPNGVRVGAVSESESGLVERPEGVRVTAESESTAGSAQPVDGVRVTALSESESGSAHSANGVGAAESGESELDLVKPVNGVRVAGASGSESGLVERPEGVRVTAESESVADLVQPVNGVGAGAVSEPESDLVRPPNGVRVAAVTDSESGLARSTNGARAAESGEPELDLVKPANGVRVAGMSESESGLTEGVRVTAESGAAADLVQPVTAVQPVAVPEPRSSLVERLEGVRAAAVSEPELDLVKPRVAAESEADSGLVEQAEGVRVTAESGPESDVVQSPNGVRVGAVAESESGLARSTNGVRANGSGESESDLVRPGNGVRVAAESGAGLVQPVTGVWVTASVQPEHLASGVRVTGARPGLAHFTNGAGVPVPAPRPSGADSTRPAEGVRVTAKGSPERHANGAGPGVGRPVGGGSRRWPGSGSAYFTNGAGVPVPHWSEPPANGVPGPEFGLVHSAGGVRLPAGPGSGLADRSEGVRVTAGSESGLADRSEGVRVTAEADSMGDLRASEADLPQAARGVPESEYLSHSMMVTALIEATIPLPRQPLGPLVGPPAQTPVEPSVAHTGQPEVATQDS